MTSAEIDPQNLLDFEAQFEKDENKIGEVPRRMAIDDIDVLFSNEEEVKPIKKPQKKVDKPTYWD